MKSLSNLRISLRNDVLWIDKSAFSESSLLATQLKRIENVKKRFFVQRKIMSFLIDKHDEMKKYLSKMFNVFSTNADIICREYDDSI